MNYISNTPQDRKKILETIGVRSFDELIAHVPKELRNFKWNIPNGISELELDRLMDDVGHVNRNFKYNIMYLGAGIYDHFVPAVIDRLVLRGEFITAYTPYQGEASQGTLQSIYEYQSLICELTGMDYSNASMYDGASSLAEAALLALRYADKKKILVPESLHPEYAQVVGTYLSHVDAQLVKVPMVDGVIDVAALKSLVDADTAAVILQQPNFFGLVEAAPEISKITHDAGALLISCVNPISLGILAPPGEYGADIAVGEGQPLGNPVSFGGPHFGFFTVKEDLLRRMPGRIAGMTVDKNGKRAFVLTLQAREQHIRREKATSNICTNQALCALKGAIYLTLLGKQGLKKIGLLNLGSADLAFKRLSKLKSVRVFSTKPFFNEFALWIDKDPMKLRESLRKHKILGPLPVGRVNSKLQGLYLFAVTEKRTPEDLEALVRAIEEA